MDSDPPSFATVDIPHSIVTSLSAADIPDSVDNEIYDDRVREFLCKPQLDHLLPVFFKLGIGTMEDVEGMLAWGSKHRASWSRRGLGDQTPSRQGSFDFLEEYVVSVSASGFDPRASAIKALASRVS